MPFLKDIARVADGLSLVAKEAIYRQRRSDGGNSLQSLIKNTLLSATDLTGLTKGKVRKLDKEIDADSAVRSDSNKESVVYFTDEKTSTSSSSTLTSKAQIESHLEVKEVSAAEIRDNVEPPVQAAETTYEGDAQIDSISSESKAAEVVVPVTPPLKRQRKLRERKVPTSSFSRALGFAGLGAGLAWGTLQESAKRLVFGAPNVQGNQSAVSPYLSEKNAERLALALCRMRGAALKLGQMLSIQDESVVPAPILAALDIVRQGADVMPRSQLNQVLSSELGHDWSSKLKSFDYEPMAAASIGQVHRAFTKEGMEVAMKIQYPGVADSIESDIENVKLLLSYTNLLPEKLFLDNAMKVAKEELSRECDYELEAKSQKRFGILLSGTKGFYVPGVIDDLSSKRVLTSELVPGIPIDKVTLLDQETRNYVGKKLLELTLMELFVFRFMQSREVPVGHLRARRFTYYSLVYDFFLICTLLDKYNHTMLCETRELRDYPAEQGRCVDAPVRRCERLDIVRIEERQRRVWRWRIRVEGDCTLLLLLPFLADMLHITSLLAVMLYFCYCFELLEPRVFWKQPLYLGEVVLRSTYTLPSPDPTLWDYIGF
ncbi:hypothetical protein KY285_003895 [Solanum tuberosum]|nr:hypothetical protein KY285_003895 [Solanum tuberosum]